MFVCVCVCPRVPATLTLCDPPQEFGLTVDIVKLIQEVDTDGSGQIEFDEFRAMMRAGH